MFRLLTFGLAVGGLVAMPFLLLGIAVIVFLMLSKVSSGKPMMMFGIGMMPASLQIPTESMLFCRELPLPSFLSMSGSNDSSP